MKFRPPPRASVALILFSLLLAPGLRAQYTSQRCKNSHTCQSYLEEAPVLDAVNTNCANICNENELCTIADCQAPSKNDQGYCTSNTTCRMYSSNSWDSSTDKDCSSHCQGYQTLDGSGAFVECDYDTCSSFLPEIGHFCDP